MTRPNTSNELYIKTFNFQEMSLSDIVEQAIEYFGEGTTIDHLDIASERFSKRGCSCCRNDDDDYDLYFCVYLKELKE